jgi:hypothetical protein
MAIFFFPRLYNLGEFRLARLGPEMFFDLFGNYAGKIKSTVEEIGKIKTVQLFFTNFLARSENAVDFPAPKMPIENLKTPLLAGFGGHFLIPQSPYPNRPASKTTSKARFIGSQEHKVIRLILISNMCLFLLYRL